MTRLDWAPLLPWPVLFGLLIAAVLVVGFGLWRRARGTLWRGLAFLFLLLTLAGPSAIEEARDPQKDIAVIVVDDSPSQRIGDRAGVTAAALATLQEKLGYFKDLEVRVIHAGQMPEGSLADTGTALFGALGQALAEIPRQRLAGVVMITDGEVHDLPPASGWDFGAPLHVLLSGKPGEADRRLTIKEAPGFGIVDKETRLTIRIDDLGTASPSADATLSLRQDGEPAGWLQVPIGQDFALPVTIRHGGPNVFELEAEPGPHELTLDNNRAAVSVSGVRDRLRVLLVTGEPHAGERSWRDLLKADPSVELVHFTILRPPERLDPTPIREMSLIAFPVRELFEDKLSQFDLVIFDRYRRQGVLSNAHLDNIARYVRNGGALLEAVGPSFGTGLSLYQTPLGAVLPAEPTGRVAEEGFKPRVSPAGERHPVTARLPGAGTGNQSAGSGDNIEPQWGRWFRNVVAEPHRGTVVMTGAGGAPLLVLDRVEKGRVAQLLSDQIWLWARGFENGGPQAELLRRLAYWLMREPDLEENDLRATIEGTTLTIRRQSLEKTEEPVEITGPGGKRSTLTLQGEGGGRSSGRMTIRDPGLYRVTAGTRTAIAAAGSLNPVEMGDVRTTDSILAPATAATGGGVFWIGGKPLPEIRRVGVNQDKAGRDWIGFRANRGYIVTGIGETPLIPPVPGLILAFGALFLAWHREGRASFLSLNQDKTTLLSESRSNNVEPGPTQ